MGGRQRRRRRGLGSGEEEGSALMGKASAHVWHYRGRQLRQTEWGLWRDLDRKGYYFLCYRPNGRTGRVVRRWFYADGAHPTLDALQDRIREIRAGINKRKLGLSPDPQEHPVRPSFDAYLTELRRRNKSEAHLDGVRHTGKLFIEQSPVRSVDQISVAVVEAFLQHRHGLGLSPYTVNRDRAHLSGWLKWARRHGQIAANPAADTERAATDRKGKPFPMPVEMRDLVLGCDRYDGALFTLLAFTGMRLGSFVRLSADSFQRTGIAVTHTKRRTDWYLSYDDGCPLWTPQLSEIGRWLWEVRPPTVPIIRRHLEKACARLGKRFTPHGLRHAFTSWLMLLGENVRDVAAWGHWSSTKTPEEWYAHLRPRGQGRADSNRRRVFTMRSQCLKRALGKEKPRATSPV